MGVSPYMIEIDKIERDTSLARVDEMHLQAVGDGKEAPGGPLARLHQLDDGDPPGADVFSHLTPGALAELAPLMISPDR